MSTLSNVSDANRYLHGNVVLSRAVLAIGTTKSAIDTTNAVVFANNGVIYNKAAMTSQVLTSATGPLAPGVGSTTGGTYVQPAGKTVYYVVCLDSAGTVTCVQGSYNGQPLGGPGLVGDGKIPDPGTSVTPFGVIKVVTAGAATFTLGTTLFDAANVTTTFYDVHVLPAGGTL